MRLALLLLAALLPWRVQAQAVVTSGAADKVSVSLYRDPNRGNRPINRYWPSGFALITETRTITVPAGEALVRFEGVADGILPESAIVTGLPGGVSQKNRNAQVLSPAALIDFAVGKRVHVRRTDRATGAVREEEAIVRAGPGGGVVIEGPEGVEALRCSGLPETLVFDSVPDGLSDKPVLSVTTVSDRETSATVSLSYIAGGFDWGSDYIATLAADGRSMDLFAWATIANGTGQSFERADTNAVAGRLRRTSGNGGPRPYVPLLRLGCWPMETTSDVDEITAEDMGAFGPPPPPAPPPPPPPPPASAPVMELVVTGSRMMAQQEELGDLKLYRIPEPVTVAAKSQKQVAMIDKRAVPVEQFVRFRAYLAVPMGELVGSRVIKAVNREGAGLGLPLPAGRVRIFSLGGQGVALTGGSDMPDLAVGEDVELVTETVNALKFELTPQVVSAGGREHGMRATVTNFSSADEDVEVQMASGGAAKLIGDQPALRPKDGGYVWKTRVAAGTSATIEYRVRQ